MHVKDLDHHENEAHLTAVLSMDTDTIISSEITPDTLLEFMGTLGHTIVIKATELYKGTDDKVLDHDYLLSQINAD